MSSLNRKLLRDLVLWKGQIVAIAAITACGIMAFVTMQSNYDAMYDAQTSYYRDFRFADLFATVTRAPNAVAERIAALPYVQHVQTRARTASSLALALSAHARVLATQSALEQADREVRRQTALEAQGYASKLVREQAQLADITRRRELQMAKTDAAAAEAQVTMDRAAFDELAKKVRDPDYLRTVYDAQMNAIRAQLRTLEDQSSRTAIVAPVSGEIMRVLQKSEAYVGAGTPLVEIGNRNTLEIVADVLSQDAVGIHVGDTMEVLRGAGNDHPRGKVRRIEPSGYTVVLRPSETLKEGDAVSPLGL